jgi:hypothetical protein
VYEKIPSHIGSNLVKLYICCTFLLFSLFGEGLLDVACKVVGNLIKGKSPEDIRKAFNIKNDFTQQEEDQVKQELQNGHRILFKLGQKTITHLQNIRVAR